MKHGLLAEFMHWWCRIHQKPIRFVDSFGGRPWTEPPATTAVSRVKALSDFALRSGQPHLEQRYYESSHIVRYAANAVGLDAEVLVSDRDPIALYDLVRSGLTELQFPGFDPTDGYSILRTEIDADLILIDPFDSLVSSEAPLVFPEINRVSARVPTVVFVLLRDLTNSDGRRYLTLKAQWLSHAWSLRCLPLQHTVVRGEGNYTIEVLLAAPALLRLPAAAPMKIQLAAYAECLTDTLGTAVTFTGASTEQI